MLLGDAELFTTVRVAVIPDAESEDGLDNSNVDDEYVISESKSVFGDRQ